MRLMARRKLWQQSQLEKAAGKFTRRVTPRTKKRHLYLAIAVCFVVCTPLFAQTSTDSLAEETSWEKVSPFDTKSISSFLKDFPNGNHIEDAKLLFLLQSKLQAIKRKKVKPEFTIPIAKIKQRWSDSKEFDSTRHFMGWGIEKKSWGPAFFVFSPMGKTKETVKMVHHQLPALPTRDGSILAIKTYGLNSKVEFTKMGAENIFGGYHFLTPALEVSWIDRRGAMYFGAIENVGFVYLHGVGKIISPDGKEIEMKKGAE
jgi:hypothetical protein